MLPNTSDAAKAFVVVMILLVPWANVKPAFIVAVFKNVVTPEPPTVIASVPSVYAMASVFTSPVTSMSSSNTALPTSTCNTVTLFTPVNVSFSAPVCVSNAKNAASVPLLLIRNAAAALSCIDIKPVLSPVKSMLSPLPVANFN